MTFELTKIKDITLETGRVIPVFVKGMSDKAYNLGTDTVVTSESDYSAEFDLDEFFETTTTLGKLQKF